MRIPVFTIGTGILGFAAGAAIAQAVGCAAGGVALVAGFTGIVGMLLAEMAAVAYAFARVLRTIMIATMPPNFTLPPPPAPPAP